MPLKFMMLPVFMYPPVEKVAVGEKVFATLMVPFKVTVFPSLKLVIKRL